MHYKNNLIQIIIAATIILLTPQMIIFASLKEDLDKSASESKAKLEQIEKEIKEYNSKVGATKKEASSLAEAIKRLEESKNNLLNQIKATELKISNVQNRIEITAQNILKTENKIDMYKSYLSSTMRNIYKSKDASSNNIIVFMSSSTLSDNFTIYNNNKILSNDINTAILNIKNLKSNLEYAKEEDTKIKTELGGYKEELNDKKLTVDLNKKEKDDLLKSTKEKEELYQKQLAEKTKQRKEIQNEISSIEAKLKAIVDVNKLPKQGNGVLNYPVKNVVLTQYFGNTEFSTKNPQVYNGSGHNGIDLAGPVGTPIYAAQSGTVIGVYDADIGCPGASYGKWIMIKHNNGLTTLYAHLSSFGVSEGQKVEMGDKIGLMGNTGYSTGPHLHFTVYASDGVKIAGPTEYKSRSCGTYLRIPIAPHNAYLNPLSYL